MSRNWEEELPEYTRDDSLLWAYVYNSYRNPNTGQMNLPSGDFDKNRDDYKKYIKTLLTLYKPFFEGEAEYQGLLSDIEKYTDMRADANHGDYKEERLLVNKIIAGIEKANEKLQQEADELGRDYQAVPAFASEDELNDDQLAKYRELVARDNMIEKKTRICADFQSFFASQSSGTLQNRNVMDENSLGLDATKVDPDNHFGLDWSKDMKDAPLFPHEPCISDVSQGWLGDCYLLSALSYVAENHPEKIREMMRDNGDGTCTVRFYCGKLNSEPKTVYVKVEKSISVGPGLNGQANNCLWVQMIEKAYALSGLHMSYSLNGFDVNKADSELVPFDPRVDEQIKADEAGPRTLTDEQKMKKAPWLYDSNGKRAKTYDLDYRQIEGGQSHIAIGAILGKGYIGKKITLPQVKYTSEFYPQLNDTVPSIEKMFTDTVLLSVCEDKDKRGTGTDEHVDVNAHLTKMIPDVILDSIGEKFDVGNILARSKKSDALKKIYEDVFDMNRFTVAVPDFGDKFREKLKADFKNKLEDMVKNGDITILEDEPKSLEENLENENSENDEDFFDGENDEFSSEEKKEKKNMNRMYAGFMAKASFTRTQYDQVLKLMTGYVDDFCNKFNKRYTQKETDFVLGIKKSIEKGQYVFSGTAKSGIAASSHAYSIHDVVKTEDGRLMLQVRNPWGNTFFANSVVYKEKNGQFIAKAGNTENGIFWIELRDYLKEFDDMYVSGPEDEKSSKYALIRQGKDVKDFAMKLETVEIMSEIAKALTATEKSGLPEIPAYRELKKSFVSISREISMTGNNAPADIFALLEPLGGLCEKYVLEASLYNRSNDNDDRLAQVQKIVKLMRAVENNCFKALPESYVSVKEAYTNSLPDRETDSLAKLKERNMLAEEDALKMLAEMAEMNDNSSSDREKTLADFEKFSAVLENATHWYNTSENYVKVQIALDKAIAFVSELSGEMTQRQLQILNEYTRTALDASQKYLNEKGVNENFVPKNNYEGRRVVVIRELNAMLDNKVRSMNTILTTKSDFRKALDESMKEKSDVALATLVSLKDNKKMRTAARKAKLTDCITKIASASILSSERAASKDGKAGRFEQMMLVRGEEKTLRQIAATRQVQSYVDELIANDTLSNEPNAAKQEIARRIIDSFRAPQANPAPRAENPNELVIRNQGPEIR